MVAVDGAVVGHALVLIESDLGRDVAERIPLLAPLRGAERIIGAFFTRRSALRCDLRLPSGNPPGCRRE
jgi:hypothetical protein